MLNIVRKYRFYLLNYLAFFFIFREIKLFRATQDLGSRVCVSKLENFIAEFSLLDDYGLI